MVAPKKVTKILTSEVKRVKNALPDEWGGVLIIHDPRGTVLLGFLKGSDQCEEAIKELFPASQR